MTWDYNIRAGTQEDLLEVLGEIPKHLTRSLAVDYSGDLACLSGIIYQPSCPICFSVIVDGVEAPKLTKWKCAIELWEIIKTWEDQLFAICDDKHPNSPAFLRRLGFKEVQNGVFKWQTQ